MAEEDEEPAPIYEPTQAEIREAERTVARVRARLERGLRDCAGIHNPQPDPSLIDDLTFHVMACHQFPWETKDVRWANLKTARTDRKTCEKMIAIWNRLRGAGDVLAELEKLLGSLNAAIEDDERVLGRGQTSAFAWGYPASIMGDCAFRALQSDTRSRFSNSSSN
jgi:hypothetical protein